MVIEKALFCPGKNTKRIQLLNNGIEKGFGSSFSASNDMCVFAHLLSNKLLYPLRSRRSCSGRLCTLGKVIFNGPSACIAAAEKENGQINGSGSLICLAYPLRRVRPHIILYAYSTSSFKLHKGTNCSIIHTIGSPDFKFLHNIAICPSFSKTI